MKKVIFVDFDDTLCLHKFENKVDSRMFLDVDVASDSFFKNSELNKKLYQFLIEQKSEGKKIVLLSSACSKMLEIKKCWIEKNCPLLKFDDYISASIDIDKAGIMMAYAKNFGLESNEIMFIDDSCSERWKAESCGIDTYNPQLVMND